MIFSAPARTSSASSVKRARTWFRGTMSSALMDMDGFLNVSVNAQFTRNPALPGFAESACRGGRMIHILTKETPMPALRPALLLALAAALPPVSALAHDDALATKDG